LEKLHPQWKERHVESSRPGELLCQDTFFVGSFKGIGKVYLQAVVDTYGSYAFGLLATSKQPETAALLLHNEVLPFYAERQIQVSAVLTDNVPTTESRISVGRGYPRAAARLPSHVRSADSKHVRAVDFHEHGSPAHHSGRMIHPHQVVISVPQAA